MFFSLDRVQVGAQTETELKEKKLRVEDALNATKAAVEEGIVIGGGCTLLKLAAKVDAIKETLPNDEQKVKPWNRHSQTLIRQTLKRSNSEIETVVNVDAIKETLPVSGGETLRILTHPRFLNYLIAKSYISKTHFQQLKH